MYGSGIRSGKTTGKIFEMGIRDEKLDARIFGEKGVAKGDDEK